MTLDSVSLNATGSFTPPGQPPLTALPPFCDVTLTQTDPAGNPVHIEVWLPSPWTGHGSTTDASNFVCAP